MSLELLAGLVALAAIGVGFRMAWRDHQVDQAARRRLDQALASDDDFTRSIRNWGDIRDGDHLR
jgi:hypothetical protein